MANRMILNETSYIGAGAISAIADEAKNRGFKKALIVTDKDLVKFGVAQKVMDLLEKNKLDFEIFDDVKANPTVANVKAGVKKFADCNADYIIAIGGGSPIDTAKAIGIITANPEFSDVTSLEGVAPTKNKSVPILAVPTTAG
ncbi:MAG: iron-containing alcohol dehydrogenase, partial [Oscillospiraceae bacterium]|nr:iron-containing alcohol dehydrogenase [Oscillospiraceae bacterium]